MIFILFYSQKQYFSHTDNQEVIRYTNDSMKRILIIDDNTQLRQLLRQILEQEGYEVIDAKDGEAGTKLYRQTLTDLVITDVVMPKKDGIETLKELKRDFPHVKIIVTTGDSQTLAAQYRLSAMKALGAEYVFRKPFGRKELLNTVHELLDSVTVH
jgi:CheY-like chemotaxis protein